MRTVTCKSDYMMDSDKWQRMATEDIKAEIQTYQLSNDKQ